MAGRGCGLNQHSGVGFCCGRELGTGWYGELLLSYGLIIHLGGSMDSGMAGCWYG